MNLGPSWPWVSAVWIPLCWGSLVDFPTLEWILPKPGSGITLRDRKLGSIQTTGEARVLGVSWVLVGHAGLTCFSHHKLLGLSLPIRCCSTLAPDGSLTPEQGLVGLKARESGEGTLVPLWGKGLPPCTEHSYSISVDDWCLESSGCHHPPLPLPPHSKHLLSTVLLA